MSTSIRWGILGTSFISGVMANAIEQNKQGIVYAIAGRNTDATTQLASDYNAKAMVGNFDEFITDPAVDVVYIALPNHLHAEWIIKAANAGKAIVCEKSLSIDMQSTTAALDAVARNKVFFVEGLMYLHHPLIKAIHEIVHSGKIGEIQTIQASYCAAIDAFTNPAGKGAIFNLGCYPASLALTLLHTQSGQPTYSGYRIAATGKKDTHGNVVQTSAVVTMSNHVTLLLHTAENYGMKADFKVLGTKGYLELDTNPWLPDNENRFSCAEYETNTKSINVCANGDGFNFQVEMVHKALQSHEIETQFPSPTHTFSHNLMALLTDWHTAALQQD